MRLYAGYKTAFSCKNIDRVVRHVSHKYGTNNGYQCVHQTVQTSKMEKVEIKAIVFDIHVTTSTLYTKLQLWIYMHVLVAMCISRIPSFANLTSMRLCTCGSGVSWSRWRHWIMRSILCCTALQEVNSDAKWPSCLGLRNKPSKSLRCLEKCDETSMTISTFLQTRFLF